MNTHDVSRRGFIGGAASAGAFSAALAYLGIAEVASADVDDNGTGSTTDTGGDTFEAQALPPVAARGVRVGVINFTDTSAIANTTTAALQYNAPGVFNAAGWLNAPLDLPVGARLVRLDVYGQTAVSTSISVNLDASTVGGANVVVTTLTTPAAIGVVQASYAPQTPRTIGFGERLYLETTCDSPNKTFLGAIYQYYDANPQLNLLPTPVRVYDSRAGANPTTVVKGALANNATRVIDCTLGGAVPLGAAAAMITLTLTGTSAGGFMSLWRNGQADPGTSAVNWDHSGTNVAVTTVVAVDEAAKLMAKTGPNASTNFIIDVIGFYA